MEWGWPLDRLREDIDTAQFLERKDESSYGYLAVRCTCVLEPHLPGIAIADRLIKGLNGMRLLRQYGFED